MKKLSYFTNNKCKVNVILNTRKIQSLFLVNDKVTHYSCVIYNENFDGMEYFSVLSPNAGKYGPEKTPSLDTFHAGCQF